MKIRRLGLKDFRCHHSLEFSELDPVTIVLGRNAEGKSSIAMAVEFLLTGRCQATDAAGRGIEDLVRSGAKEAVVQAEFDSAGYIGRRFSAKSHLLAIGDPSLPVPVKAGQAAIEQKFGVSATALSAALNSWRFVQMSEADQRALLAAVLAAKPVPIPDELLADLRGEMEKVPERIDSSAQLEGAHKFFFDLRTAVNRQLREFGEDSPLDAPPCAESAAELEKKLSAIHANIRDSLDRRSERVAAHARLAGKREQLQATIDELDPITLDEAEEARLSKLAERKDEAAALDREQAEIQERIRILRATISEDEPTDALIADGDAVERVEAAAAQAESIAADLAAARAGESLVSSQIAKFEEVKAAQCPTCTRSLTAADRKRIRARMDEDLVGYREDVRRLDAALAVAMEATLVLEAHEKARSAADRNAENAARRELLSQTEKSLESIQKKLVALAGAAHAAARLQQHRQALAGQMKARRELAELPAMDEPNTADLDRIIAELEADADRLEGLLSSRRAWEERSREAQRRHADRAKLESHSQALDRLVAAFGPKGPIAQALVGDGLPSFTARMNRVLAAWGYGVSIQLDPYALLVTREGDPYPLKLRQLSRSEAWRFGVAFQIALAQATGLGFVIVDEADVLDLGNRMDLVDLLLAAVRSGAIDQALVLATGTSAPPDSPEGVQYIPLGEPVAEAVQEA